MKPDKDYYMRTLADAHARCRSALEDPDTNGPRADRARVLVDALTTLAGAIDNGHLRPWLSYSEDQNEESPQSIPRTEAPPAQKGRIMHPPLRVRTVMRSSPLPITVSSDTTVRVRLEQFGRTIFRLETGTGDTVTIIGGRDDAMEMRRMLMEAMEAMAGEH